MKVRRWLIDRLLNQELRDSIFKELWENGKRKGAATYQRDGKTIKYRWSNADKLVAKMSYEAVADDEPIQPTELKAKK